MAENDSPRYLILDTESVPDGLLIGRVRYPKENLGEAEAIARAQTEARERSSSHSDFLPVTFQIPVAVCLLSVGADFRPRELHCLDAPDFRPGEIVRAFWKTMARFPKVTLVSYNGRGFDLPLLEMAAFRYGCSAAPFIGEGRRRFSPFHFDIHEWLGNYGAHRPAGGLNLLSKLLGQPGKMEISGNQVYDLHCAGKKQAINDYCMFDVLDTYFVFLRTRVMAGELALDAEQKLAQEEAKAWIVSKLERLPALQQYLDNWGNWTSWP
jgi:predicted PolB exonuclease-like 3'-5' exonuclease